ncbi:MAG: hypothetical protein FWC41_14140 [Firmicutes bacterium]|nr:hypothetical protein [Bacillota bacterium]
MRKNFIISLFVLIVFLTVMTFLFSATVFSFSLKNFAEHFHKDNNNFVEYTVLLKNGDMISGKIIEIFNENYDANIADTNNEIDLQKSIQQVKNRHLALIINSNLLGEIIIYEDEIVNIKAKKTDTRQNHSLYLMPTANPISNNHFIGNYELVLIYGGIGLTDWVSLTAGHTMIPETRPSDQISLVNVKVSSPAIFDKNHIYGSNIRFALGGNLAWVNSHNKMFHLYGVATFNSFYTNNSNFSVGVFYKAGYQDYPSTVRFFDRPPMAFDYPDGSFGMCAGLERRFPTRKDLSLIMEVWNSDVMNAANTAILLGFRLSGAKVYADFGISFFTQPFAIPFFSFVWMPFN